MLRQMLRERLGYFSSGLSGILAFRGAKKVGHDAMAAGWAIRKRSSTIPRHHLYHGLTLHLSLPGSCIEYATSMHVGQVAGVSSALTYRTLGGER